MTTIVYRNGVLAADSQTTRNGSICAGEVDKVHVLEDGRLAAFSGEVGAGSNFLRALKAGDDLPDLAGDAIVVVVQKDGTVHVHQDDLWFAETGEFFAWGTGLAPALGALHVGATAEEAVAAACKVDPNSGGRVHAVRI